MSRLKEIHDYLISFGKSEEELRNIYDGVPWLLSEEIACYAHRKKERENGETYINHPLRCSYYLEYSHLFYEKYGMSYEEVSTLCKLHDVIEDSDFTLDEINKIFEECGLGEFFKDKIYKQLDALTYRKDEVYETYIEKCMKYPSSALVKLVDSYDNLNVFTLIEFNEKEYNRCCKYIKNIYRINSKYKFIENINKTTEKKEYQNQIGDYKSL